MRVRPATCEWRRPEGQDQNGDRKTQAFGERKKTPRDAADGAGEWGKGTDGPPMNRWGTFFNFLRATAWLRTQLPEFGKSNFFSTPGEQAGAGWHCGRKGKRRASISSGEAAGFALSTPNSAPSQKEAPPEKVSSNRKRWRRGGSTREKRRNRS